MSLTERDAVFAALADEHRRVLLEKLRRNNGQTLSRLCDGLPITRQAVTKHLVALESASLIVTLRRGREKLHYLNPVPIHAIAMRWLRQFDSVKLEVLASLDEQRLAPSEAQEKGPEQVRPSQDGRES